MVTSLVWYTAEQKAELWERWRQGQSISSISRSLERRTKGGVQRIVSVHGGIAPPERSRAAWTLELGEREEISRGIAAGLAIRAIARSLGRSPSTICREIARNGGAQAYRATRADKQAWERALRPKRCRLACSERLRWLVAHKLALEWSPEQIAGWLRREYPGDPDMRISHEAIYRSLFIQSRGVLKKELTAHLRTRCQMRLAKGEQTRTGQGQILDMISVRERPAEAEDRAVPGHWEGDLLAGANDTNIVTLVERHSRLTPFYVNLVWVVDGRGFKDSFDLYNLLPEPDSEFAADLVWYPAQRGMEGSNAGMFWRRSENPDAVSGTGSLVRVHPLRQIRDELMANYVGHQQYHWVRRRKTWLDATCPVYIDFGDEWLFWLER